MGYEYNDTDERDAEEQKSRNSIKSDLQDAIKRGLNNSSTDVRPNDSSHLEAPPTSSQTADLGSKVGTGTTAAQNAGTHAVGTGAAGAGNVAAGSGIVGSGAGAAGGTAGGAASGAAAGSVAPGVGTAIGAALGTAGAKHAAQKNAKNMAEDAVASTTYNVHGKSSSESTTTSSISLKVVATLIAVPIVIVLMTVMILFNTLTKVVAPVISLMNGAKHAWESVVGFVDDIGNDNPTFEETSEYVKGLIRDACKEAYQTTCYREVYQIAEEKEYDIDLTIDSYNQTQFPYVLDGTGCNINYAEILGIMSLSDKFNYQSFTYKEFKELFNDQEFLRCLYDLTIIERERLILDESEGLTVTLNDDGSVTVTDSQGTSITYTKDEPGPCRLVKYGEVHVNKYPLKKIYDYFSIDPYEKSKSLPSMNNHQALSKYESMTRAYKDMDWGNSERSPLLDYEKYTDKIANEYMNTYIKDLIKDPIIQDGKVYLDVKEFKQGDSLWKSLPYGSSNIGKLGCCLTSMAMVCNYYSSEYVDPGILWNVMKEKCSGQLVRPTLAEYYGFKQYNSATFDPKVVIGELNNERLCIVHIRPGQKGTGKWGHWVVICGYEVIGDQGFFYIKEPASRLQPTVSFEEASMIFYEYQTYGR